MWRSFDRALMAGGPIYDAESDAGGSEGQRAGEESAQTGSEDGQHPMFKLGYAKAKTANRKRLLKELGFSSVEEAKKAREAVAAAREAEQSALKEQGKYRELYEGLLREHKPLKARLESIASAQQDELEALTEKLTDEDKKALEGLPPDKALAIAKRFAAAVAQPVGGKVTGKPAQSPDAAKRMQALLDKGIAHWTPEERIEVEQLKQELYKAEAVAMGWV